MHYLATIKMHYDSSSMMFPTEKEAKEWLDSQNNNLEHTTIVTIYDDKWNEIGSYVYTEGEE